MTTTFEKILFQTAFCCMASDGKIDEREIAVIQSLCERSPALQGFDSQAEMNGSIEKINTIGKQFILDYLDLLKENDLTAEDELTLLDFAVQTIQADEVVEYSEIKFFKNIRRHLKINDKVILERFPDIEYWLEDDIITEYYLDSPELPQFDLIVTEEKQ